MEEDLRRRYSPEQIVGRLRRQFPDDPEMRVSAETIYQSLYVQSRGALRRDLTKCLRTGRALRRPRRRPGQRRNQIPDMINIAERPAEADDRAVPGHWEGDLILGKNNLSAIGTLVERTTGYTMLVHLPDGYKAEQVRDALTEKIKTIPEILRTSLTWDQGPEMRDWQQVSVAADIDIYFCDPHSPWQRATNENTGVPPVSWTSERLGPSGPAGKMWCACHAAVPRTRSSSVVRPLSWRDERPDDQGDRRRSRCDRAVVAELGQAAGGRRRQAAGDQQR